MPLIPPQNLAAGISLENLNTKEMAELEKSGFLGLSAKSAAAIGLAILAFVVLLLILSL